MFQYYLQKHILYAGCFDTPANLLGSWQTHVLNQSETDLRLAWFPAIKNNTRTLSWPALGRLQEVMDCRDSNKERKGKERKEVWTSKGSVCLFWYFLLLSKSRTRVKKTCYISFFLTCYNHAAYLDWTGERESRMNATWAEREKVKWRFKSPFGRARFLFNERWPKEGRRSDPPISQYGV